MKKGKKLAARKPSLVPQKKSARSVSPWLLGLLLIIATLTAYLPAMHGGLIWDDDAHLTRYDLSSLTGLGRIWTDLTSTRQYYPVVHSCFWLGNQLWGHAVLPYHLTNILLHAGSAVLLVAVLRKLGIPGAWLAGSIFALHPVQVESVAWMSELKNTLSGFFYFAAALTYLRFSERRDRFSYVLALSLFVLGLLSKSVIATLPAVLLVAFWWRDGRLSWRRHVVPLAPFLVLGFASGLFTAWVERRFIGAEGQSFNLSIVERVLMAGRVFWFYLAKLFWPAHLTFIYPRWQFSQQVWWQYLFPLAAVLLVGALWFYRKRERALLAGVLIFAGTLVPVLGFVNVYPFIFSFVADHFQYLACIGIITPVAAGIAMLCARYRLPASLQLVLPALLGLLTWAQAGTYRSADVLYRTTLERNPQCWMAHNNLGVDLMEKGQVTEAIAHYQQAMAIEPTNAESYTNLGNAYMVQGRAVDAARQYERTLLLAPRAVQPKNNLAWLLATSRDPALRDPARAVQLAQEAVATSQSKDPIILRTLATAYAQCGRYEEASATVEKALRLSAANAAFAAKLSEERKVYRSHLPAPR